MKTIARIVRALVLTFAILVPATTAAEKPTEKTTAFPTVTLPAAHTITDTSGRKLEGTILSKTETSIKFRRVSDGKEFDLPLDKLSAEDKAFVAAIPNKPAKKITVLLLDYDADIIVSKTDTTVKFRRADGTEFESPLDRYADSLEKIAKNATKRAEPQLQQAGFDITLVPYETIQEKWGPDFRPAVKPLTAAETKKYDVLWINGWVADKDDLNQIFDLISTHPGIVVFKHQEYVSRRKFLEEKTNTGSEPPTAAHKPFMKRQDNLILYFPAYEKWRGAMNERESKMGVETKIQYDAHPEIVDQIITEIKREFNGRQ